MVPDPLDSAGPFPATLLIVDDEPNVISALRRALRGEGYRVLTARSGESGLQILEQEAVDVVLSDQRMPGMSGIDFLRQAKALRPATVRMVLSGYSELNSMAAAVNEGAIYKYLTKPWDDDFLRASIREAFARKGLSDENRRLATALSIANHRLEHHNDLLTIALEEHLTRQQRLEAQCDLSREALEQLPVPVLVLNPDGGIALFNRAAEALRPTAGWQIGQRLLDSLPAPGRDLLARAEPGQVAAELAGQTWRIDIRPLGPAAQAGRLLTFLPASHGLA